MNSNCEKKEKKPRVKKVPWVRVRCGKAVYPCSTLNGSHALFASPPPPHRTSIASRIHPTMHTTRSNASTTRSGRRRSSPSACKQATSSADAGAARAKKQRAKVGSDDEGEVQKGKEGGRQSKKLPMFDSGGIWRLRSWRCCSGGFEDSIGRSTNVRKEQEIRLGQYLRSWRHVSGQTGSP